MYTLYGKKGAGSATVEAALTLVLEDGSAMSESAAILIHLGLVHPTSGLLPDAAAARAQVVRGLVFIAANCYAAISIIDFPERWCEDSDGDEAMQGRIRAGTRARLYRHWEMFADVFPAHPWLSGERIGALDLLTAVVSKWSGTRKHLEAHRPTLHETLLRIEAHPEVAAVFARNWPPG